MAVHERVNGRFFFILHFLLEKLEKISLRRIRNDFTRV